MQAHIYQVDLSGSTGRLRGNQASELIGVARSFVIVLLQRFGLVLWGLALGVCLLFSEAGRASAQSAQGLQIRTVAIVNDEAITNLDLQARQAFLTLSGAITPETSQAERFKVSMDELVDERVRIQEARAGGIRLTTEQLNKLVARLAERQKKSPEQYLQDLEKEGVPRATFLQKLEAQEAWQRLVMQKLPTAGVISPDALEDEIEARKARAGEEEVRMIEIFLSYEGQPKSQVLQNAETIMAMAERGTAFDELAIEFSQAPSQADRGLRDWVSLDELDPAVQRVVAAADSTPRPLLVEGSTGAWVIAVIGKRKIGQKKGKTLMDLKQLFLKLPQNIQSLDAQRKLAIAAQVTQKVKGCSNFNDAMISVGDEGSGDLNQIDISTLPAQVGRVLQAVPVGTATPPLPVPNGASIFMVCGKSDQFETVKDEEIRRSIIASKAERFSERYFREVRRKAFIELLGS